MRNDKQHLEPERLAAFDQEPFTTDEREHLARCDDCRREHRAYVALGALAQATAESTSPLLPRLVEWDALSSVLRREGLLTSNAALNAVDIAGASPVSIGAAGVTAAGVTRLPVPATRVGTPTWLRMAAAVVLMAGGAAVGRMSANAPFGAGTERNLATLAGNTSGADAFGSVQQASALLYRAQSDYERASLWLAANDTTMHSSDVYRARLEALDQMMAASRAALREAPQDPVLNHYFLSAYTAREATLQALGGALPVDKTLERY